MIVKRLIEELTNHTQHYDEDIKIVLITLGANRRIELDIHQLVKIFNTIEIQVK